MKKLFFLAALISLASPFVCCKSKKAAKTTAENTSSTTTTVEENKTQTYRLIVSFISKGEGTNSEKRKEFLIFVETYPKKPIAKTVNWGREGETDYCFTLSELLKKEQIEFVNQVKKIVAGSDLISVSEDVECMHKGR